ncbi:hypothetical protein PINS_up015358 [Pythium insidiosum]|nr:hypothetical protein PINS_up015358 [Pythium insidiosum]
MEWLFGPHHGAAHVDVKLSASTPQGRSAPSHDDESAHKQRGNTLFKSRDYEGAVAAYSEGIEHRPSATLYSNRSAAYCALGRFELALRDADAAIALDPTWAKTFSRKGKALYGMQSFRKAADAYARGLELSLKGAVSEANQRDAELEALKRQTESQSASFMKLMEENAQLKRQLEDYNLMFEDWSKKAR